MIELFIACVSIYQIAIYDEIFVETEWAEHVLELSETELSSEFVLGAVTVEDLYCYQIAHASGEEMTVASET